MSGVKGKKVALIMSAEENNFSARLGNVQQMSQLCHYLHHELVGVICTAANSRSDVLGDPNDPLKAARRLGRVLFDIIETNFRIDSEREKVLWQTDHPAYKVPAYWR